MPLACVAEIPWGGQLEVICDPLRQTLNIRQDGETGARLPLSCAIAVVKRGRNNERIDGGIATACPTTKVIARDEVGRRADVERRRSWIVTGGRLGFRAGFAFRP